MNKDKRQRRSIRIRAKISGSADRPRTSVFRSQRAIGVQVIDDTKGHTILSVVSGPKHGNAKGAFEVGQEVGKKALEMNIKRVVFDRSGYRYHGRVKALAEGMRKAGLVL